MNHRARRLALGALAAMLVGPLATPVRAVEGRPKKIVLIAGKIGDHPPGTHEYEKSCRLLQRYLDSTPNVEGIKTEVHLLGWPQDAKTLDDADTIVLISDGSDRDEQDHPLLVGDRLAVIEKQMQRGCGLVAIHWTTFFPGRHGEKFLEWIGGYFDYESGTGPKKWFSKIETQTTTPRPASPNHPICRGIEPFELRDEYYFNIRFREKDPRLVPILSTPIAGEPGEQVVAWAVERKDTGRGFGFTGGHFFENWSVPNFRRLVLNAILWTAKAEVPAGGVKMPNADDRPIKALIVTGHHHPAHDWKEVTKALEESLAPDSRFTTTVTTDPEFLATEKFAGFDVVVLNYCNWERPGLTAASKDKLQQYVDGGGGLVIVHFANGAFHASLPNTPESDWPEYRKLCRRVWDHANQQCGHDAYGKFRVEMTNSEHPITHGLAGFETTDELYFGQQGDLPIEVLATARSKATGKDEPMAFVYRYGNGRVFQTVLGHAAESVHTPGTAELMRRGCIWAAGRPQRDE